MSNKVSKISNSDLLVFNESFLKILDNKNFNLRENFNDNFHKLNIGDTDVSLSFSENGILQSNKDEEKNENKIKIFISKFKNGSCEWSSPSFFSIADDQEQEKDWSLFYSNSKFLVYKIHSFETPNSLPLDGDFPTNEEADFIRYKKYINEWLRKECQFKYDPFDTTFVYEQGTDEWELVSSDENSCIFEFVESVPSGCSEMVPSLDSIEIPEECSCVKDSSTSSISEQSDESSSTLSSESSKSIQFPDIESIDTSSSELQLSPQTVSTVYLKIVGEPFGDSQHVLNISNNVDIEWKNSDDSIVLKLNNNGLLFLSVDKIVNNEKVKIENAPLTFHKGRNIAKFFEYIKGFSYIDSKNIKSNQSDFQVIISHENMKENDGDIKNINEIILDFELSQMRINEDFDNVSVFLDFIDDSFCRAHGLFCLNKINDGLWEYSTSEQSIRLLYNDSGLWQIERNYIINNSFDVNKIVYDINPMDVSELNDTSENFFGLSVISKNDIESNKSDIDQCDNINTIVSFFSNEDCEFNIINSVFDKKLSLTISNDDWLGKDIYDLTFKSISSNLGIWYWTGLSTEDYHEYAVMSTIDGNRWKINIGFKDKDNFGHILIEINNMNLNDEFKGTAGFTPKSLVNINGDWSEKALSYIISIEE